MLGGTCQARGASGAVRASNGGRVVSRGSGSASPGRCLSCKEKGGHSRQRGTERRTRGPGAQRGVSGGLAGSGPPKGVRGPPRSARKSWLVSQQLMGWRQARGSRVDAGPGSTVATDGASGKNHGPRNRGVMVELRQADVAFGRNGGRIGRTW